MRTRAALMCVLVGTFLATPLLADNPDAGKAVGEGKALFQAKCVLCHGKNGAGDGPASATLNPPPADFTSPGFWKRMDAKKIAETIRNGHGMMPAFGLEPGQIEAIIDYMTHTFKKG